MIRRLFLFDGEGFDPYHNLAVEQYLTQTAQEETCVLYLWQNRNTVVIGRNQNAWKECRVTDLETDGGHLARRPSGGGAVFHDLGNLNFSFLLPTSEHNSARQSEIILTACRALGIPAEMTGRNDLTADGKKFSGHAFYHNRGCSCHHGTLLLRTDMEKLGKYLKPSSAKLHAKGVDSVRSRVVNLSEFCPSLTTEDMRAKLHQAFETVYGLKAETLSREALDSDAIGRITRRNRSWEWNFGQELPFDVACEQQFAWGELRLELQVRGGIVSHVSVWTDAMDWSLADALSAALKGCRFEAASLCGRISSAGIAESEDICALIRAQI